jgi:hypothetical protein
MPFVGPAAFDGEWFSSPVKGILSKGNRVAPQAVVLFALVRRGARRCQTAIMNWAKELSMLGIAVQKGKRIDPDNPWPGRQNRDKLQLLATGEAQEELGQRMGGR